MNLQQVRDIVSNCDKCSLCKTRKEPVIDRGDDNSSIFICGMCPGPDENEVGKPFVGTAGKLLDKMIEISFNGITPYITNLVKCFVAPGIKLDEFWMSSCLPYLIVQIDIIKPKCIIALGSDVCNFLTGSTSQMKDLRKTNYTYCGSKLICTYHPSYFARGGGIKHHDFNKGIEDFKKGMYF